METGRREKREKGGEGRSDKKIREMGEGRRQKEKGIEKTSDRRIII